MSNADINRFVGISFFMMGHQYCLIYTLLAPFNGVFVMFNIVQALLWIGSTPS